MLCSFTQSTKLTATCDLLKVKEQGHLVLVHTLGNPPLNTSWNTELVHPVTETIPSAPGEFPFRNSGRILSPANTKNAWIGVPSALPHLKIVGVELRHYFLYIELPSRNYSRWRMMLLNSLFHVFILFEYHMRLVLQIIFLNDLPKLVKVRGHCSNGSWFYVICNYNYKLI